MGDLEDLEAAADAEYYQPIAQFLREQGKTSDERTEQFRRIVRFLKIAAGRIKALEDRVDVITARAKVLEDRVAALEAKVPQ